MCKYEACGSYYTGDGYVVSLHNKDTNAIVKVKIWVNSDTHDVDADWVEEVSRYTSRGKTQEEIDLLKFNDDDFVEASGIASCYLEQLGYIRQDAAGNVYEV